MGEEQQAALRALALSHLRVDMMLAADTFQSAYDTAARASRTLSMPLEIALWLEADAPSDLARLAAALTASPVSVARWLVFQRGRSVAEADTQQAARDALLRLSDAPVYGGTDEFFTQLNREPPNPALVDGLTYSTNPQVHAFDHRTLTEALTMQGVLVSQCAASQRRQAHQRQPDHAQNALKSRCYHCRAFSPSI